MSSGGDQHQHASMSSSMKKFVKRAGNAILFGSHNHAHTPGSYPHHLALHPLSTSASPMSRQRSLSAVASMPDLRYLSLSPRGSRLVSAVGTPIPPSSSTTGDGEHKRSLFEGRTDPGYSTPQALSLDHTHSAPPSAPGSRHITPPGSDDENEPDTPESVASWSVGEVCRWLSVTARQPETTVALFRHHAIDGQVLLTLTENDLRSPPMAMTSFGDMRRLIRSVDAMRNQLGLRNVATPYDGDIPTLTRQSSGSNLLNLTPKNASFPHDASAIAAAMDHHIVSEGVASWSTGGGYQAWIVQENLMSITGKFLFSLMYSVFVIFATAFVMVLVHERVPDSNSYPPLPDIVLDSVTRIPFAFTLVEIFIVTLAVILICILMVHQNRFVVLRRFNAIVGTCFLIRCCTMYITSLSVPGTHLDCKAVVTHSLSAKLARTWEIASGLGLSINGVHTCGDYMFSGHTVALTNLNYFVNEYSPIEWKGLHIFSWILNVFGMFLILASHEHYSIDVFIAFYISSRLFCRYHSMTNVAAVLSQHGKKNYEEVDGWFPFVSYLEEYANGVVPNVYEAPWTSLSKFIAARRAWAKAALARARKHQKERRKQNEAKIAATAAAAGIVPVKSAASKASGKRASISASSATEDDDTSVPSSILSPPSSVRKRHRHRGSHHSRRSMGGNGILASSSSTTSSASNSRKGSSSSSSTRGTPTNITTDE